MIPIPFSYKLFCLELINICFVHLLSSYELFFIFSQYVNGSVTSVSQYLLQILYVINILAALFGFQILLSCKPLPPCSNMYLLLCTDVIWTIPFNILLCQTFYFKNPIQYSFALVYSFVLLKSIFQQPLLRKHAWEVYFANRSTCVILH